MGGVQSAQRESEEDSAAAEESGKVHDAQTEHHAEHKIVTNNGQMSDINGKADGTKAEVDGHAEDEISAVDRDVSEAEKPLKEETPLEKVAINEVESSNKADANEEITLDMMEMNGKQNDINESFKRLFSSVNLKVTVKRGSAEKPDITVDVPEDTTKEEPNRPEYAAKEVRMKSENAEHGAHETYDHELTCQTLTDVRSEDVLEAADKAGPRTTLPVPEDEKVQPNAEPEEEMVVSPIKRFFTTGIFFGLRRKRKPAEDEATQTEPAEIRKTEAEETTQPTVKVQQDDIEISVGVEAVTAETERKENELKEENLSASSARTTGEEKTPSTATSTIIVSEAEILSSQEKDKIQASPLKRLLSASSLKKSSKKQRERKSSDARMSDSGEHVSNQLLSSIKGTDDQTEECPAGEEDGAWASFKKLVTPKKSVKKSSLTNEEKQIPGPVQESKLSEGEQMSDHSTEEGKKRKDSSVSWEAVLCGSGRRRSRSRKTSDSEDENPQGDDDNKQDSTVESSNEVDGSLLSSAKQAASPLDADGASTWKSFKKLVTPKRKAKDEDTQSDVGATQDDSSFSIKNLLPGQKKRMAAEKQDYVSSDEADKEVASDDEDSLTPAVVPLSEFDTVETGVHLQTDANIESHVPKEPAYEIQQDVLHMTSEPFLLSDSLQTEAKKVQENKHAFKNETFTAPASNVEPEDVTELISKHQQLSDIPEEGVITETVVTPASVAEEAARDDTIAEDMIEITSEAITAPEPVDNTLADETEMVSAVSHLSESSKTSGNATPVPAEYDIKDTEEVLQQVVENICISLNALPVCSEDIYSKRIVASVSHQIFQSFKKQDQTILEIHRSSDATAICTGLKVKELHGINELAATAQKESLSEVSEAVSTEFVSEVPTEEFDTAELSVDEILKISVTHLEESIKTLESTNENHDVLECESEVNEATSTEIRPKSEETVVDECSLIEAHQAEPENCQIYTQEEETRDGGLGQKVQSVLETKDAIMQLQAENQEQPPVEVQELQVLTTGEATTLNSTEDIAQLPEKEVRTEDIPPAATMTDEPKEEPEHLTEDNAETQKVDELQEDAQAPALDSKISNKKSSEKDDKLQTDAAKIEHDVTEVLGTVQDTAVDSEIGGNETPGLQMLLSEDIVQAETVTYEPKEEPEPLTKVDTETDEEDELQTDAAKIENVHVSEVLGEVLKAAVDSEMTSVGTPEKEVPRLEDSPSSERVMDEPKEEIEPATKVNVEPEKDDELKTHPGRSEQVQQVLVAQAAALDSEIHSSKTSEKEILLTEDTALGEAVRHEIKDKTESVTEVNAELEKKDEIQTDTTQTVHVQVSDVVGSVQATAVDLEIGGIEPPEILLSEDIVQAETVTYEPKEEPEPVTEITAEPEKEDELQVDAAKTEYVQVSEVLGFIHEAAVDAKMTSTETPEKEVPLLEDIPSSERVMGEPREEIESVTKVTVEPEKDDELQTDAATSEQKQLQQVFAVDVTALESEMGSTPTPGMQVLLSDIVPPAEAVTEEPEEKTMPVTEVNVMCVKEDELQTHAAKTEYRQVPEVLAVQAAALDPQIGSIKISEREIPLTEDTAQGEAVTRELVDKTEPVTEVNGESEKEDKLKADAAKIKNEQVSEVSGQILKAAVDTEMNSSETPKKDVPSLEDISPSERVPSEPKEEPEHLTEVVVEPEKGDEIQGDAEYRQVSEVLAVQAAALCSEISTISEKENVLSEDTAPGEAITHELKDETAPVSEVNVEWDKEDELQTVAAKIEDEVSEVLGGDQPITEDSETDGSEISKMQVSLSEDTVQAKTVTYEPKEEPEPVSENEMLLSEDTAIGEAVTDELKDKTQPVIKVDVECEKEDEKNDAAKIEHVQVSEVLGGDQASTVHSQIGGTETSEMQVSLSEDTVQAETVTYEPKEEPEPVTEVNVEPEKEVEKQRDAAKTKYVQVSEVLGCEQAAAVDSEMTSTETPEVPLLEDIPSSERDEPKEETEPVTKVTVDPEKDDELQTHASKTEYRQVSEVLAALTTALDSEISSSKISENEMLLSEDTAIGEAVTDELKDKTQPVIKVDVECEKEDEKNDAAKIEHVQVSEVLGGDQASTVHSQIGGTETSEMQVSLSEDTVQAEIVTYEHKAETEPVTEVTAEPEKEDEKQRDAAITERVHVSDVLEGVEATAVDLEMRGTETLEMQIPLSEDIPQGEAVTCEVKKETKPVPEDELDKKDKLQTDSAKSEYGQVPEVLVVQGAALDLEMANENEDPLSEDIPLEETMEDLAEDLEAQVTTIDLDEGSATSQAAPETQALVDEPGQAEKSDSEQGRIVSLEMEVISGETQSTQSVDEPLLATEGSTEPMEEIRAEDAKTEDVQESEVLSCNGNDTVTETEPEVEATISGHGAESVEGADAQQSDFQNPDADYVIGSVTDQIDSKAGIEFNQALETNEDQTAKSLPQDVHVEQEAGIPEVADKFQTLSAVHVSSVNEETNCVPVLEKKVISEETPEPCVDNATVTYEPKHEVQLSEVQGSVQGEKQGELPGAQVKISAVEHAVVAQVITCNLREVSAAIPDVLIEQRSDIREPLMDTIANELEFKEEVETATPKVQSDVTQAAKEERGVAMMQVPSAEFENTHGIQVQVFEVDVEAAEILVDSVVNVGVTEAKEVVGVCHESVTVQDTLSATEETEKELINEENTVIIHKVIQHVKEDLPESLVVQTRSQEEVVNLEQEPIKLPDDVTVMRQASESESDKVENQREKEQITIGQRRTEAPISDDSTQTLNVPRSLDSEDSEEHKAGVTAEEVKPPSEDLEMKTTNQEAQIFPTTTSKTGSEAPQNTGETSLIGHLESYSSPLEGNLNLQSGQAEPPASPSAAKERSHDCPPPATERTLTDESELGVHAVDPQQNARQILSEPHLYEAYCGKPQVENPPEQTEEENEQDLWMDAEEDICTQEQSDVSGVKVEEPGKHQTECDQEEKAELQYEAERAPDPASKSQIKEEESQQEMQKTGETGETENESEEFSVAPEHLGTTSVALTEWE
ncbi:titin isoform X1 [Channa argus]|uniref:titin isoform X1 n=2 Tax=Channa argus TaxID=215402 RepID=UPI0035214B53